MLNSFSLLVLALVLSLADGASAQSPERASWSLPGKGPVSDAGPRTYRFTVVYQDGDRQGAIVHRTRISGEYTRGLEHGEVAWRSVSQAEADGPGGPFGAPKRRDFMEGLRYKNDMAITLQPKFFDAFPPTAVFERNLVWDTGMIERFGQQFFDKLQLNVPLHAGAAEDVEMPGVGSFHNRDVILEWVGNSYRNAQDCAVIDYRAFLNPLQVEMAGMALHARSEYWGQIWVSVQTRQIEYATLYEEVSGELKLSGQERPQPLNVFRSGVFEPLANR